MLSLNLPKILTTRCFFTDDGDEALFHVHRVDSLVDEFVFFATGRLHRGRFDGFVVVQGIVSNDPKHCSTFVIPGIGFLGHYKSGKPNGECWRELLGGAWIYGKVKEEGLFTGTGAGQEPILLNIQPIFYTMLKLSK